jgi:hypothetical protein
MKAIRTVESDAVDMGLWSWSFAVSEVVPGLSGTEVAPIEERPAFVGAERSS